MFKLKSDGSVVWELDLGNAVFAPLIAENGMLYCPTKEMHLVNAWMARRGTYLDKFMQQDKLNLVEITQEGEVMRRWQTVLDGSIVFGPGSEGEFYGVFWKGNNLGAMNQRVLARIDVLSK